MLKKWARPLPHCAGRPGGPKEAKPPTQGAGLLSGHQCNGHVPFQKPVAGCQFTSGHFLLSILQKNILMHCWSQKIHCIRWRVRVANVCILQNCRI